MEKNNSQISAVQAKAMEDEVFLREMVGARTTEDARKVLEKYGFTLSREEMESLMVTGKEALEEAAREGELSEDELDTVAGGGKVRGTLRFVASLAIGGAAGFAIGLTGGAAAPGAYIVAGALTVWTLDGYAR